MDAPWHLLVAFAAELPEAEVRSALRRDAMGIAFGVLFVALAVAVLSVFRVRDRGRDPAVFWFGLFALLFGVRLLALADTVRFAMGVPREDRTWFYAAAAITYIIPLPALLFLREAFPRWRRVLWVVARFLLLFAVTGLICDQVTGRPESLRVVNSAIVLVGFLALLTALFWLSSSQSVRVLRVGVLTFSGTVVLRNLSNLQFFPLRLDLEPLGFAVFLAALGRVVVLRGLEREQGVAALNARRHAAEQASRAKSAVLANISHELRTPLNAILGYAEILRDNAEESGDRATVTDLDHIRTASRHLLTLINSVLDISKIEAGKMDVEREEVDIRDLVKTVVGLAGTTVTMNGNRLVCHVEPGVTTMVIDRTKLQQILVNLLSNAGKFTDQGTVTLRVRLEQVAGTERVVFDVQDTGRGMTPEEVSRLFRPFEQASPRIGRDYGGTGLGLVLSRRLCEVMKGQITVESQPKVGSTFRVSFPAATPPESQASAREGNTTLAASAPM